MRILLTNDDGINAEGLAALERIAAKLSDDVWVCAPEYEQSGASRALTLAEPIRVRTLGPRKFATTGTPTDCVMLGVRELMDGPPDLVLSGVNRGANQGEDVIYSGTVAVAMEAAMFDIPAIAMSQIRHGDNVPWQTAAAYAETVIRRLVTVDWPRGVLMNVNFPAVAPEEVKGLEIGGQGRRISNLQVMPGKDPFGRSVLWIGDFPNDDTDRDDTDLALTAAGKIAVTPLHFDLTHRATAKKLSAVAGPLRVPKARKSAPRGSRQ